MPRLPHPSKQLLRCRIVAQRLDVSVKHVYRLIQQGDLDAVRIGARQLRVTRESLDELLHLWRRDAPAYPDDVDDTHSPVRAWRRRPMSHLIPEDSRTNPPLDLPRKT